MLLCIPKQDYLICLRHTINQIVCRFSTEAVPYINVPLHTLLVVRSYGYDFCIETVPLQVECVDTYRIQPKNCSPERTDADALDTVPAHFDTALPQAIN